MKTKWEKTADPLVFTKELLPVGEICPWLRDDGEPIRLRVKEPFVDRLVENFKKFHGEVGNRVPIFNSPLHKEDPDLERGLVIDVQKRLNSKGKPAAFITARFHDAKAAELGTKVDVSAGCPKTFTDGKGNKYEYPLCHVALTSRPLVPELDGWEGPLLCSFSGPHGLKLASAPAEEDTSTDDEPADTTADLIGDIMFELGLQAAEDADEITMLQQILAAVQDLPDAPEGDTMEAPKLNLSSSPVLVNEMKTSRQRTIKSLAKDRIITPALAEEWTTKYCSDAAVAADLELSHSFDKDGKPVGTIVTAFDSAVELAERISKDRPSSAEGRQFLKLSHGEDGRDNVVIAAAKRKAGIKMETANGSK